MRVLIQSASQNNCFVNENVDRDNTLKLLREAAKEEDGIITILELRKIVFDGPIVSEALRLFRNVSRQGRRLHLVIDGCWGPCAVVLRAAMALESVSSVEIIGCTSFPATNADTVQLFSALSWGIECNPHLEKVHLTSLTIGREQAIALCDGLRAVGNHHFKELYMTRTTFSEDAAVSEFADGLRANSSLDSLTLYSCSLRDAQIAQIIEALLPHPSLKELALRCDGGHTDGLTAIGKLLAANRRLEHLALSSQRTGDLNRKLTSHIYLLAEGMEGHPCLKKFDLSGNQLMDQDLGNLTQILSTCPRLERITLCGNEFSIKGLAMVAEQKLSNAVRWLDLGYNSIQQDEEGDLHILKLLQDNLRLEDVEWNYNSQRSDQVHKEIRHFKDLNRSGRYLLGKDNVIPLSAWSLVLARVNKTFQCGERQKRQANVIFHLLQGPALIQRRLSYPFEEGGAPDPSRGEKRTPIVILPEKRE
jgi:hypothetical protein